MKGFHDPPAMLVLVFLIVSAAPHTGASQTRDPAATAGENAEPRWQPIFQGVEYQFVELDRPRPLRIHQVRVDTRAPGIEFLVTPGNGPAPGEVNSRRTTTFVEEFKLEVAINGTGFDEHTAEGEPVGILGLAISNGNTVSPPHEEKPSPVLVISPQNRARIVKPPITRGAYAGARHAIQGWAGEQGMLVDDGQVTSTLQGAQHPRTAVGVNRDGTTLMLVVVDGRRPGTSEGMTLRELGQWMQYQGCWDAMNLDGGGSSTLVVATRQDPSHLVNQPSTVERVVANHLGIQALPLQGESP